MFVEAELIHCERLAFAQFLHRLRVLCVILGSDLLFEVIAVEPGEEPASVANWAAGLQPFGFWFGPLSL